MLYLSILRTLQQTAYAKTAPYPRPPEVARGRRSQRRSPATYRTRRPWSGRTCVRTTCGAPFCARWPGSGAGTRARSRSTRWSRCDSGAAPRDTLQRQRAAPVTRCRAAGGSVTPTLSRAISTRANTDCGKNSTDQLGTSEIRKGNCSCCTSRQSFSLMFYLLDTESI